MFERDERRDAAALRLVEQAERMFGAMREREDSVAAAGKPPARGESKGATSSGRERLSGRNHGHRRLFQLPLYTKREQRAMIEKEELELPEDPARG